MPDYVYLNDKVVPLAEARVSVLDHGFLYGDGLFETMRACGLEVHLLEQHLDRLFKSATIMKLEIPWTKADLKQAITEVLLANNLDQTAVRLTVSRGEGLPIPDPTTCKKPTLVITCRSAPALDGEMYTHGVEIAVLKTRRNYDGAFPVAIKSTNFLNNIFARQELKETLAYEGIMLNYEGFVAEGTVNNLFFVRKDQLMTPSLECGILDGVVRAEVIRIAGKLGIEVAEGKFGVREVLQAEEIFLTNSVTLIVPVKKISDSTIPKTPGPITVQLSEVVNGYFAR